MRNIILWILIGGILGIFAGYYITTTFLIHAIPGSYVSVTVVNQSGQLIKSLTLKHEKGNIEMQDLMDNDQAKLTFKNLSENSYQIIAVLDNGTTVSSRGEYVESGYTMKEIIYEDRIEQDRNQY
jgi:fluoride ion exporter CrcB/FEX